MSANKPGRNDEEAAVVGDPRRDRQVNTVAFALSRAERNGFRIAVIGRTIAIMAIALASLFAFYFPINVAVALSTAMIAVGGLASLLAVGTRYEMATRFALFAFDAGAVTCLLAFVPLSSGDDIPQNLVFLTSSAQHYYLVIAASALTLSPTLVLWTGAWAVCGLLFATGWIVHGMEQVLTYSDLPIAPTRDVYFQIVLSPNFIGIPSRLQEALIIAMVTATAALAVHRARQVVKDHANADASHRHVRNLFRRYVPAPVLRELLDEGHLVPQTRETTLLFADIEGFTRLSETMAPVQIVSILNELFTAITGIVDQHDGIVINYVGDAVIASFNAPLPTENHPDKAIEASRQILAMVEEHRFGGVAILLRIGIATGSVAAGTVGADERQVYTLYGDAVNLSQRLQELNKVQGTRCLIAGSTVGMTLKDHRLQSLGMVQIRNLSAPTEIFGYAD